MKVFVRTRTRWPIVILFDGSRRKIESGIAPPYFPGRFCDCLERLRIEGGRSNLSFQWEPVNQSRCRNSHRRQTVESLSFQTFIKLPYGAFSDEKGTPVSTGIPFISNMVPKAGFEPPRVSQPPPQDGVSARSTTSAHTDEWNQKPVWCQTTNVSFGGTAWGAPPPCAYGVQVMRLDVEVVFHLPLDHLSPLRQINHRGRIDAAPRERSRRMEGLSPSR
jgi:hypothetical protein